MILDTKENEKVNTVGKLGLDLTLYLCRIRRNMKKFKLLLLFLLAVLASCRSPDFANGDFGNKYLSIGFTTPLKGVSSEIILLKNGDIILYSPLKKSFEKVNHIKPLKAWVMFRTVKKAGIMEEEINEPGKLMRIELKLHKRGQEYSWVWGQRGPTGPSSVQDIVVKLRKLGDPKSDNQ